MLGSRHLTRAARLQSERLHLINAAPFEQGSYDPFFGPSEQIAVGIQDCPSTPRKCCESVELKMALDDDAIRSLSPNGPSNLPQYPDQVCRSSCS